MPSSSSSYPGFNPKAMEAWFTLMAEAMRGVQQAQQAFDAYARMSGAPEEWQTWLATYMPGVAAPPPASMEAWVEEWQKMLGVVPRQQYVALLAKNAELQRRLEQAEATIGALQALVSGGEAQAEAAKQVMDTWSKMLDETLKTQSEWMKRWNSPADDEKMQGENE